MEDGVNKGKITGNTTRCVMVVFLLFALNALADFIVDLESAGNFAFLDIGTDAGITGYLGKGAFTGDIGWLGASGTQLDLKSTLTGDLYRSADSSLRLKGGTLLGTDHSGYDMSGFVADVDAAVARFGLLSQDIDLGSVDRSGGLTIDRTDAYTVVDMDVFKLSSGTLTLNGQVDDIFYIRVSDIFELSNVDIVVNGTDSSRVFFIYGGSSDLVYDKGDVAGNIIAPNAAVLLSKIDGFNGSVISGNGFSVVGARKDTPFNYTEAIPESTILSLVTVIGGGAIFVHRIFRFRKASANS